MKTVNANKKVCDYFALLKKTGKESPCITNQLLTLPLLVEMTEGSMAIYNNPKSAELIRKFIDKLEV